MSAVTWVVEKMDSTTFHGRWEESSDELASFPGSVQLSQDQEKREGFRKAHKTSITI
jgi:hypothetical protein